MIWAGGGGKVVKVGGASLGGVEGSGKHRQSQAGLKFKDGVQFACQQEKDNTSEPCSDNVLV